MAVRLVEIVSNTYFTVWPRDGACAHHDRNWSRSWESIFHKIVTLRNQWSRQICMTTVLYHTDVEVNNTISGVCLLNVENRQLKMEQLFI